jgi:hypothetical protein
VATELTLASGAPVIGPDPVGLTGTAGSAVPGSVSGDGTSFTVTVKKAQTPPGPLALAAGDTPRHLQRAAGIRHAADLGEGR